MRDFINVAANIINLKINWQGSGLDEKGCDQDGRIIIRIDPRYFRPTEVETLLGDASKAKEMLGWQPKIKFEELVKEMMDVDLKNTEKEILLNQNGFDISR